MKVLIGIVTAQIKSYCDRQFFDSVKELIKYGNGQYEVVIVDNSKTDAYFSEVIGAEFDKEISAGIVTSIHYEPEPGELINDSIAYCQNVILDCFKNGKDYSHLFMLESDVICKPDIIEKLKGTNLIVCAGGYFIEAAYKIENGISYTTYILLSMRMTGGFNSTFKKVVNETTIQSFMNTNGHCRNVFNPGLGSVLIRKDIFIYTQNLAFYTRNQGKILSDSIFYEQIYNANIFVYIHTGIYSFHNNKNHFMSSTSELDKQQYLISLKGLEIQHNLLKGTLDSLADLIQIQHQKLTKIDQPALHSLNGNGSKKEDPMSPLNMAKLKYEFNANQREYSRLTEEYKAKEQYIGSFKAQNEKRFSEIEKKQGSIPPSEDSKPIGPTITNEN